MVMAGLVLAVMAGEVTLEAVINCVPAVIMITLKVPVPAVNAVLAGRLEWGSLTVMPTMSVAISTRSQ